MRVIGRYATSLNAKQSKLVLIGVSEPVYHQLEKTGLIEELGRGNVYKATSIIGDSALDAWEDAKAWLLEQGQVESDMQEHPDG